MPDIFSSVPRSFLRQAVIAAASALGVFAALPCARAELAERLAVAPRRLGKLIDALLLEHLLVQEGSELGRAPDAQLDGPAPPDSGAWSRIAESVRRDCPVGDLTAEQGRFHLHLWRLGEAAGHELWRAVPGDTLLDIGGGAGAYSAAWLDSRRNRRATLVDEPRVLKIARERLGSRIVGLAPEIPPGRSYDVALLCNVLHLHDEARCAELVAQAAATVRPGGRLIIKDLDPRTDDGVWFALNMALYTDGGEVHTPDHIAQWLRVAGLSPLPRQRLAAAPSSLVLSGSRA